MFLILRFRLTNNITMNLGVWLFFIKYIITSKSLIYSEYCNNICLLTIKFNVHKTIRSGSEITQKPGIPAVKKSGLNVPHSTPSPH